MKIKITLYQFYLSNCQLLFLRMMLCGGGAKNRYSCGLQMGMYIGTTSLEIYL